MQRPRVASIEPNEDDHFKINSASFDDGFNLLKTKEFTGRCMIRASDQFIAIEICENEDADGVELCRKKLEGATSEDIDRIVKEHVETFISIVEERQLLNFAIAVFISVGKELTFKFLYNENALLKYYWDTAYRLLHVEIPKNYDVSPNRHEAEIKFGIPPTAGASSLRMVFEDLFENPGPVTGRSIYAYNSHDVPNRVTYYSLHDHSQSLLSLVANRDLGWANEVTRRNKEREFAREKHPSSIFNVKMEHDFVRALLVLRRYDFGGHLVIYVETESLSLGCRNDRFASENKIFETHPREPKCVPGPFLFNKRSVEEILKLIWERRFLKYTIVFDEVHRRFPLMLRYEHGSEFHTHIRHYWDAPKKLHFLTVVHSGRSDNDTLLKEIHMKVGEYYLDDLIGFHTIQKTCQRQFVGSSCLYKTGSEFYSTEKDVKEENTGHPDISTITNAIKKGRHEKAQRSLSRQRSSSQKKKTGNSSNKK